jgi:hypothetical protein
MILILAVLCNDKCMAGWCWLSVLDMSNVDTESILM